jgi:hypothetical protein
LLVSLLREQGELHVFVTGSSSIAVIVCGMLCLPNQGYGLIKDWCCLSHITPHFRRVGQHLGKFPREVFLGFFVILVASTDATDQTNFLVFVVRLIDSCV